MLTDEEITKIQCDLSEGGLYPPLPIIFARAIERAALAKAMPIPKQEPVPYVFFKKVKGKDEWSSWNEFSDGSAGGKPLFERPQPAQAAAIPDNVKDIISRLASELESEIEGRHTEGMMIYPSIKSKYDADMGTVIEARELLSASPKP